MAGMTANETVEEIVIVKDFRYYLGMFFFLLSFVMPIFGFLVPCLGMSPTTGGAVIAFLLAGGPELCLIAAAAFWGKKILNYFKKMIFGFIKRGIILRRVSKVEYYMGLTVNLTSIVPLWLHGYFPNLLPFDPNSVQRVYFLLVFDLLFLVSFLFLGGRFWEKIRRVFVYDEE